MRTIEDKAKQAQCEIDAAIAKRNRARQLWDEAEEELVIARIKLEETARWREK